MTTVSTQKTPSSALKAYVDKIAAQVREAKARLEQFEAKAKEKEAQTNIDEINSLKAARQEIDRKLQDLTMTHDSHVLRAKVDIDADVARFKAAIVGLTARLKKYSPKK